MAEALYWLIQREDGEIERGRDGELVVLSRKSILIPVFVDDGGGKPLPQTLERA